MRKYFFPILLSILLSFVQTKLTAQSIGPDQGNIVVEVVPSVIVETAHQNWLSSEEGQLYTGTFQYVFTGMYWKIPWKGAGDLYFAIYLRTPSLNFAALAISADGRTAIFLPNSAFGYPKTQVVKNQAKL